MECKELLKNIKEIIRTMNTENIREQLNIVVNEYFAREMGYKSGFSEDNDTNIEDGIYSFSNIDFGNLVIKYFDGLDKKIAINFLTQIIDNSKDEMWGILLHADGLWVLNNMIRVSDTMFRSEKIVFKILYNSKTDQEYFKYLSYDNLFGIDKRNAYFFRDIITYKNTLYKGSENGWHEYHSMLKRFYDYYCKNYLGYVIKTKNPYESFGLNHFEEYMKKDHKEKSLQTIKNQFFFIKDMLVNYGNNENFKIGSGQAIELCRSIIRSKNDEVNLYDIEKIKKAIKYLEQGRNGLRDKTLFLMLLCFGVERRNLCLLKWNEDIDATCEYIKRGSGWIEIPNVLKKCLVQLKTTEPEGAIYVFGSSRTKYSKPLPESGINGILSKIMEVDKGDIYYKSLSPANIRKMLFRHLLAEKWPMQNILLHMNIPISNIGNYVSDDKMWEYKVVNTDKEKDVYDVFNQFE